jgi:hemoglobin-like flavoprotein
MTNDEIALVKGSYGQLSSRLDAIGRTFYERLFAESPDLRALFPIDLTRQESHFEAALALIFRNLGALDAIEEPLMGLGADHVRYGARPEHYWIVRRVLLDTLETHADPPWTPEIARAWWQAVTIILQFMLRGAAVATAMAAERLGEPEANQIQTLRR